MLVKAQLYKKLLTYNSFASSSSLLHSSTEFKNEESRKEINKNTEDFLQWFVGFSDAESNFIINPVFYKNKITSYSFLFKIALHIDDMDVLKYIHDKLGIGSVRVYKNECIFNVTNKEGIYKLIEIFDKFNLNTTKYFDYIDFKKAFILYNERDRNLTAESLKDQILDLKISMNNKRTMFNTQNHKIIINKNWLLGFIEGDGSFFLKRDIITEN